MTQTCEVKQSKHYRRNFACLALDFCFFGIGLAFFGPSTVIPSFLNVLGASASVIGLMSSLQRAGWLLPQLFAARTLTNKPHKKRYILIPAVISRSLLLVLAVLIWGTQAQPPSLITAVVVLTVTVFWIGDGLASVPWFELLSKSIPPNRRGRLTTVGQVASGLLSFLAGFLVEWLLSDRGLRFPNNYATLFALGFAMLAVSFIAIAFSIEERADETREVPSWREFIPQLWQVMRNDHGFLRYMIARQLFNLNVLALPFYMTYALDRLQLPEQVAGRYTSIGVIGSILAAIVFGWTSERLGTRRVLRLSTVVTAMVPLVALLVPLVVPSGPALAWAYGLVFFMLNASMSSYMPGWTGYVLELAPEAQRPVYVGLNNTLNGITTLFSTLGGLILQWTGENYNVLFIITMLGTLLALPFTRGLPEPREDVKS